MMATLSVVGTRAMQVYTSAQFARARVSTCGFLLYPLVSIVLAPFKPSHEMMHVAEVDCVPAHAFLKSDYIRRSTA